jgi:hypothetical protein
LPATALNKPALLFHLDGLGAGDDDLYIDPRSSSRLAKLLGETAAEAGIPVVSEQGKVAGYRGVVTRRIPWIYVAWSGEDVALDRDDMERVQVDKLQAVGEALALALTKVVRLAAY